MNDDVKPTEASVPEPVVIKHRLWTGVNSKLNWEQFQQGVKDAKNRLKR